MPLEAATYINSLVSTNPDGGDSKSAGDDHLRLIKAVLLNTLPGLAGRIGRIQGKTANYNLIATDNLTVIAFTGGGSLTLGTAVSAATLGNGFNVLVIDVSGGPVTFDPSGAETVNGISSILIPASHAAMLWTDGALWYAVLIPMSGNTFPTGAVLPYSGTAAPAGFVLASGRTIGNVSSGATERANEDTQALYTLLWNAWDNTVLPIQDFLGAPTPRGASAALDFVNSKRLPVPDLRGRVPAGLDNMGGTSANRLTGASGGLNGDIIGAAGGAETHILTGAESAAHTHDSGTLAVSAGQGSHSHGAGSLTYRTRSGGGGADMTEPIDDLGGNVPHDNPVLGATSAASIGALSVNAGSTASTGSGGAHNNVQPTIAIPYIIKL